MDKKQKKSYFLKGGHHLVRELGLAIIIFALISWALLTSSGLRTIVKFTGEFIPGQIAIKHLHGRLIGPIYADQLHYQNNNLRLTANNIKFDWDPINLLRMKLLVNELQASNIEYEPLTNHKENLWGFITTKSHGLKLPLSFNINGVALKKITILHDKSSSPLVIDNISLAIRTSHKKLHHIDLTINGKPGSVTIYSKYGTKYLLDWDLHFPTLHKYWPTLSGQLQTSGKIIFGQNLLPKGSAEIKASKLRTNDMYLGRLRAHLNLTGDANIDSGFSIELHRILIGDDMFGQFYLSGTLNNKTAELTAKYRPFSAIITTKGAAQRLFLQGGSITAKLFKSFSLQENRVRLEEANLTLTNTTMAIKKVENGWKAQANTSSGKGTLSITGNLITTGKELAGKATIDGNNFQISNSATMQIVLSPQLKLELTKGILYINGIVTAPLAYISPQDFRDVKTLPDDVVFVQKDTNDENGSTKALKTHSNIKLILGEKVNLNVVGLKGRLSGTLFINEDYMKPTTATGLIKINDGTYNIYGQKLTIKRGNIIFAGGVITNPQLDIRGERVIQAMGTGALAAGGTLVTAGVQVSGPLKKPIITLYSDPTGLSQTDILSYLLTGQAASHLNQQQAGLLLQAASFLNIGGGGGISHFMAGLKEKFGLSELGLSSEEQDYYAMSGTTTTRPLSNTAFVLGKYLSPSLYVSYSVGLLDHNNTVSVRKNLSKNWAVQTESGTLGSGADILYSIER